jgi:hypothetical protein
LRLWSCRGGVRQRRRRRHGDHVELCIKTADSQKLLLLLSLLRLEASRSTLLPK